MARPSELRAYLVPQDAPQSRIEMADLVLIGGGAKPQIEILELDETMPAVGHTTRYAIGEIYAAIEAHRLCLLFVNTRMQAELLFQELWRINDLDLPIALHHGSLDALQRRKVEAAMAAGSLRAVVATSTLDLGIDWGDVDLVIHVGAPKGASRFIQRIGRSNHRLDEPSQAILVPSNRFEVLECRAAVDAAEAGEQDVTFTRRGALDVLAQHILGTACAGDFDPDALYAEATSAAPYASLKRETFDRVLDFVADGGYALKSYERFAKLKPAADGKLRIAHPRFVQAYRMNAGTIVAAPMIKVRLVGRRAAATRKAMTGGRVMGEVDEYFIEQLRPGDAFVLAGEVLRFEGMSENEAFVTRATRARPDHPQLQQRQVPAVDASCRARARHAGGRPRLEPAAAVRRRLARAAARALGHSRARRGADRDLPARQLPLSRRLSVRGPAGASDARHAADAPPRPHRRRAARLRRQRLRHGAVGHRRHLGAHRRRQARPRRAVRRGHAGRRPRRLARRNRT